MLIANVDFPLPIRGKSNTRLKYRPGSNEPVRPRRPTRSPAFRVNDTSWSTAGRSGAYLMTRFSATRRESFLVFDGQYAGTRWDSITAGGSCGKSRLEIDDRNVNLWMQRCHKMTYYSMTRSTALDMISRVTVLIVFQGRSSLQI